MVNDGLQVEKCQTSVLQKMTGRNQVFDIFDCASVAGPSSLEVCAPCNVGLTPLHAAAECGHLEAFVGLAWRQDPQQEWDVKRRSCR